MRRARLLMKWRPALYLLWLTLLTFAVMTCFKEPGFKSFCTLLAPFGGFFYLAGLIGEAQFVVRHPDQKPRNVYGLQRGGFWVAMFGNQLFSAYQIHPIFFAAVLLMVVCFSALCVVGMTVAIHEERTPDGAADSAPPL
jgi:hypothetical protein